MGVDPKFTIMIGDDIQSDVWGAQQAGIKGILVRTGKFSPKDLHGTIIPDLIVDSIADICL
jgi:ribonucleotide monophosphatase NagD (HAD superfamily)